jgi:U32 family peptidase
MLYNWGMELLAPAGNLEKLKTAVRFGAGAVYCGAGSFSLRAADTSFNLDELAEGINYAHQHGCRVYLALNIFPFDDDFSGMEEYLRQAVLLGIDAVIISDPGVLSMVHSLNCGVSIHLSTQANTTNSRSARFWYDQGVDRIVLARELSLDRVAAIKQAVPGLELEIFIHGAMCMSYSGRCLLSSFLSKRSANRGLCSQPCRWDYALREVKRSEELTLTEDARGTYILNSRDLCMIDCIPEIAETGIDAVKIEGRMKTAYYVAATTRVYRAAIDRFKDSGRQYTVEPHWREELGKISHRPYTTGFYLPDRQDEMEETNDSSYIREYDFVGIVENHDPETGLIRVNARNRFSPGEKVEILDPSKPEVAEIYVQTITAADTGAVLASAHNSYRVDLQSVVNLSETISPESILRRKCSG